VSLAGGAKAAQQYFAAGLVFDVDGQRSRVVWIADFLPNDAQTWVAGMIGHGMAAMKATLDARSRED
jgi:hypothetical protein